MQIPEDRPALRCEILDGLHNRTESRNRASAQIISVTKSTRDNHRIRVTEAVLLMPDQLREWPKTSRNAWTAS
jgi:hypothetical protein